MMSIPWIEMVDVDRLIPTPDNPRAFRAKDEDDPYLVELCGSIKADGVLVPLLARPHPEKGPEFLDLRAGECRRRAAILAGLKTVPVIVRDLSDREAISVTMVENKHRPLAPLEEARGIQTMLGKGWTIEEAANQLGLSVRHVARRVRLTKLTKKWQTAIANGRFDEWSVTHYELIAPLPKHVQDDLLEKRFHEEWQIRNGCNIWVLRRLFSEILSLLSAAGWKKDDETLVPAAGACTTCSKRSDVQPELFDDPDTDKKAKKTGGARCLDAACFKSKHTAWVKLRQAELKRDHKDLVISANNLDFARVKKGDVGAVPVFINEGQDAGEFFYGKSYSRGPSRSGREHNAGAPKTMKERRAQLATTRAKLVTLAVIAKIEVYAKDCNFDKVGEVFPLSLVFAFGTAFRRNNLYMEKVKPWDEFNQANDILKEHEVLAILGRSALEVVVRRLQTRISEVQYAKTVHLDDAQRICVVLGIDYKAIVAEVEAAKPEPKSWARLNADVTPKDEIPAKAKPKSSASADKPKAKGKRKKAKAA
jgi:ParB/RepB/Spo0J family partition protein